MTAVLYGVLIAVWALVLSLAVVWTRWKVRDRRRREQRVRDRLRQRDELDRRVREIRLRLEKLRPDSGGGARPLSASSPARAGRGAA
jgi:type VI protein secretion system component VasK